MTAPTPHGPPPARERAVLPYGAPVKAQAVEWAPPNLSGSGG